jgi:phage terminase large subunit GpA-like protein
MGVDVQKDWLELQVIGWGIGWEFWVIEHGRILGDPAEGEVWQILDQVLRNKWQHENGLQIGLSCTLIDSAGHWTHQVYEQCRKRRGMHLWPCVGRANLAGQSHRPLCSKPHLIAPGVELFTVGVDTAKEFVYRNLTITKPGPGYAHFSTECDEEYFKGLCSEKSVVVTKGFRQQRIWKKTVERNEVLDTLCYALAALRVGNGIDLTACVHNLAKRAAAAGVKPVTQIIAGDRTAL